MGAAASHSCGYDARNVHDEGPMLGSVNVSFVGCGGMAAHYLGVYRDLDWVRVVSCVDRDLESARKAAGMVGGAATADFSAALASDVDTVIISTPNSLHRPQAAAAIEAGKHVLL